MDKKILYTLGIIILIVLGYFALQKETTQIEPGQHINESQPHEMGQMSNSAMELISESIIIPFNKSYSIDEEWSLIVNQFEPDAKIADPGTIASDSGLEQNPAVKVNFYKNGELIHYQIVFKEAPGFHSVKPKQKYILDFIDYDGFKITDDNKYSIENANLKIWRIK